MRNQKLSLTFALSLGIHGILLFGYAQSSSIKQSRFYSLILGKTQVKRTQIRLKTEAKPVKKIAKKGKKKVQTPKKVSQKIALDQTVKSTVKQSRGRSDAVSKYLGTIRSMVLKNKRYPRVAKRLGQQGKVAVYFEVSWPNKIENISIHESSPFKSLNNSALDAVRKVGKLPQMPEELKAEKLKVALPLSFELL